MNRSAWRRRCEHGHEGRRGFHASWVQAGVPVGLLLANGVFHLASSMDEAAFLSWGWRIPFLLGVLLLGVGLFIRLAILESPIFEKARQEAPPPKIPILAVLRDHPRNVVLAMGARFAENAFFYIFTVLVLSYGSQQLGLAKPDLLNAVLLGSAAQLVFIPWFGALSDRLGRRPVYLGGALGDRRQRTGGASARGGRRPDRSRGDVRPAGRLLL